MLEIPNYLSIIYFTLTYQQHTSSILVRQTGKVLVMIHKNETYMGMGYYEIDCNSKLDPRVKKVSLAELNPESEN